MRSSGSPILIGLVTGVSEICGRLAAPILRLRPAERVEARNRLQFRCGLKLRVKLRPKFGDGRVQGTDLSEFLSAYDSQSLPPNSVSSLFRNSIFETVFHPVPTNLYSDLRLQVEGHQVLKGGFVVWDSLDMRTGL